MVDTHTHTHSMAQTARACSRLLPPQWRPAESASELQVARLWEHGRRWRTRCPCRPDSMQRMEPAAASNSRTRPSLQPVAARLNRHWSEQITVTCCTLRAWLSTAVSTAVSAAGHGCECDRWAHLGVGA